MLVKIIETRNKQYKQYWIDLNWTFKKGFSLAISGHLKMKKRYFTITFFSLKRLEPLEAYIPFRIRLPLYAEHLKKRERWFDVTIANHMLNFGW